MIRQTGGAALGEISTRSRPASSDRRNASFMGTTPICWPSLPINLTCGALMRPLTRTSLSVAMFLFLQNSNAVARGFPSEHGVKRLRGHTTQILTLARAHGQGTFLRFLLAHHQQIRDTLQGMLADFKANFLVSQVGFDPPAVFYQGFFKLASIVLLLIRDGQNDRLHRGQPGGQRPGMLLNQNADKTLQRAQNSPVQHDRDLLAAVFGDISGTQSRRHGKVHLDGPALPYPTEAVLQREFDLGAI